MGTTRNLVILLALASLTPALELVREDWLVGHLMGKPAATVQQRIERLDDGRVAVTMATTFVLQRTLGGKSAPLEIRERQRHVEDADGRLLEATFLHDEGQGPVMAAGKIVDRRLVGTVTALGRTTPVDLPLVEGIAYRGEHWVLGALGRDASPVINGSMALLSNRLIPITTTGTLRSVAPGGRTWSVLVDAAPVPVTMVISPDGRVARMALAMGPLSMVFTPTEGPVPLIPAALSPGGLVTAAGPEPAARGGNRLQLPEGVRLVSSPFQSQVGGVVHVTDAGDASPAQDDDRRPGPTCESDAPELVAWARTQVEGVADQGEQAERLRVAVRAHITTKDLSVADGSALQTFRNRTGDCSEHASLLAGALRAVGIPARIVVGLVFSPPHGGWVGHAWVEAQVGNWTLLDAAYPGINRCRYLALGVAGDHGAAGALLATLAGVLGKTITVVSP